MTQLETQLEAKGALDTICAARLEHLDQAKASLPEGELRAAIAEQEAVRSFSAALRTTCGKHGHALICESKRRSPSGGELRPDLSPSAMAQIFSTAGAACLSVLTEPQFFGGSAADLQEARQAVSLPVLRKDFILDPWQVLETRAIGADCLLLILTALGDTQARELEALALEIGLEVLVEVTNEAELERGLSMQSPLLGINNRNLQSLKTDLSLGTSLLQQAHSEIKSANREKLLIAESGIHRAQDLLAQRQAGAQAFLVGESLMVADNPQTATEALVRAL